jgi:hypothetical protein
MMTRLLPLLLLLTSCASESSERGGLVPVAELPERHREVWSAYHTGGPDWTLERERVLDDPALAAFLVDNLVREMVRAYDRSRISATGRADGPFERARAELVTFSDHSAPVLVELVRVGDSVVAFLARDTLREIGAGSVPAAAALLDDPKEFVRGRGAELLFELPGPAENEDAVRDRLAELVATDESWLVRAQCARALGRRGSFEADKRPARIALAEGRRDEDPKVVETSAKALGDLGAPRAVPGLIDAYERAIAAGDLAAMRGCLESLRTLTGADRRAPEDWRRFWSENKRDVLGR